MPMRALFHPMCLPIGIDIGATGVRLLQLRRRGRSLEAVSAARIDLPEAAGGPESTEAIQSVVSAIGVRISGGGYSGRACVVSVDDRLLRVRSVRHPRMPDEELGRAVILEAPARLGFPETEPSEVGWIRAGEVRQGDEFRDEVILVGARRDPIERLVFGLARIGLRPMTVEPGFMACARLYARSLRRAADQNTVKVLVDIGLKSTGVTILRGHSVAFHKPLEIGGQLMTLAAAERLGMEPQAILDLRRRRMAGTEIEERAARAIFEAVRPTMMDIANEVSLCLRYFGVSFRGSRPESCELVGGDAAEPRFAELVGETLNLPTSVGHPLKGVSLDRVSPLIGEQSDAGWAVAAGLGLRGLRAGRGEKIERRRGGGDPDATVMPDSSETRRRAAA